ncbi:MAG: TIGR00730 family Rossman fold protein [Polyangiales bacterium]|nr:TIGR00730 family Rossman fold protein [Myxococcales bacterium]
MASFRRIGVYCGSRDDVDPRYLEAATAMGTLLGKRRIGLVFGGGRVGLMGRVADAALAAGGEVIGVMPKSLYEREIAHLGLSELLVVDGMHSRKMIMHTLADAFIGLPGGWGTMDEIFEVLTWNQIGYHQKPVGLLNVGGYFNKLLDFFDHMVQERFVAPEHRVMMLSGDEPGALVDMLGTLDPPR